MKKARKRVKPPVRAVLPPTKVHKDKKKYTRKVKYKKEYDEEKGGK
ncbi:MAG: hypothetical protein V3W26_01735 [Thermodesulfobacteriota bacterium]